MYDVRLAGLPFTYPSFAAVVMVPFAVVPWVVAVAVWTTATFVSLIAVWRMSVGKVLASPVLLGVVAGSSLLEPVRETLGFGQVNLMLCALILYDVLGPASRPARGIWGVCPDNRELDWTIGEQFSGNAYLIAALVAVGLLVGYGLRSNRRSDIDRN